jgi:hypothetical protein
MLHQMRPIKTLFTALLASLGLKVSMLLLQIHPKVTQQEGLKANHRLQCLRTDQLLQAQGIDHLHKMSEHQQVGTLEWH